MKICALDLETIPSQVISETARPQFDPNDIKVGNVKDPIKINEKIEKARQEFEIGLSKKMSTDKDLCQITTFVGYIYTTSIGKKKIINEEVLQWPPLDSEYEVVDGAWDFIKWAYSKKIPLVTFNGNGFDLPVLFAAAMRLDIPISKSMYDALIFRYENNHHYDLMKILTGETHPVAGKTLDFYLSLFQLGNKTEDMDGSKVYPLWQAKEYDKISEYCKQDVLMTAKLFERVEPWIVKDVDVADGEIEEDAGRELNDQPWIDAKSPETGII